MTKRQDIVLIKSWQAPYTADWNQNVRRFVEACELHETSRLEAQFFFSYIIMNQQWKEEMIWYDHSTGEVYEGEEQIPPDREHMCSLKPRWEYQEQFVKWCIENVPGFNTHTFRHRHRSIDKLYELGMDFVDAVKLVAGVRIRSGVDGILEIFNFDEYHQLVGYKQEYANQLPNLDIDSVPEDEKLGAVTESAMDLLKEQALAVEDGVSDPRRVAEHIRKTILNIPKVSIKRANSNEFPYVLIALFPRENSYDLGEEKRFYFKIYDENGEVLEDFPAGVLEWWENRFYC